MKRALLLNTDFSPIRFISDEDAIVMFYKGTAEIVTGASGELSLWAESFRSPSTTIRVPATLRLIKRVNKRWRLPKFRKKVLFNRDSWSCQYCNKIVDREGATIEHIFPSSRGGETSWQNCVTACKSCNKRKANRTPDEAGMKLLKQPIQPTALHFWDAMRSNAWHEDWAMFLPT